MDTKGTSSEVPFFVSEACCKDPENKLLELVRRSPLWQSGTTVLAACSGGADSLALTDAMLDAGALDRVDILVAHVQHHLRGDEAERDAQLVEAYCKEQGAAFVRLDINPKALAEGAGLSLEDAARRLRYEALEGCRKRVGASAIFTAHHLDDQAETVLLNLLRGAGTRGFRGMLPVKGYVARPLLAATRQDTEAYCRARHLHYCTDSTNDDTALRRNWVRKVLLPLLREQNPRIAVQLAQSAAVAAWDEECLGELATAYTQDHQKRTPEGLVLDTGTDFLALPLAVSTRILRQLVEDAGGSEMRFDQVQQLYQLILRGIGGKSLDVPGKVRVTYRQGRLTARKNTIARSKERAAKYQKKERQRKCMKISKEY